MKLCFYDKDGKMLVFNFDHRTNRGSCGNIYKINNEVCLKRFSKDAYYNEDAFEIIINMDLKNFYKVYEMLYDREQEFAGYIMKYYQPENIDILTMPISWTLDNFYSLYDSIDRLIKKNILVEDLHDGNVIVNKDGITVIDIDMYKLSRIGFEEEVVLKNKKSLYALFRDLYVNSIVDYHYGMQNYSSILRGLFDQTEDSSEVSKKLKSYKYPIDYIRAKRNM